MARDASGCVLMFEGEGREEGVGQQWRDGHWLKGREVRVEQRKWKNALKTAGEIGTGRNIEWTCKLGCTTSGTKRVGSIGSEPE